MRSTKPSSSMNEPSGSLNLDQPLAQFDSGSRSYHGRGEPFSEFALPLDNQCFPSYLPDHEIKKPGHVEPPAAVANPSLDWDPRAMLSNLSFLEQKIHQVQDIVRSIVNREGQFSVQPNELAAQQQLVTADLTCIIIQLISTAGSLLPSIKNTLLSSNPSIGQLGCLISSDTSLGFNGPLQSNEEGISSEGAKVAGQLGGLNGALQQNEEGNSSDGAKAIDFEELFKGFNDYVGDGNETIPIEDHDVKDSEDGMDGEHLPPGSYEILQLEKEEILAPHTHFCTICGKGFKRDANLRMHMRGHGDEYKTPAALAKPTKESSSEPVPIKRYSCPFTGCKRNKEHRKFQPLKTILCVKNHYKRSHCDKSYICSRCNSKRFSVIADLKTHEKHCGRDKWLCSCGTTFSRKDKLFGHVALFQGHTPALPMEEAKGPGASDQGQFSEVMSGMGSMGYNFTGNSVGNATDLDIKGVEDDRAYFSPMNLDSCNFGGLDEFPRAAFELSESPFSLLPLGSCNFVRKNGENLSSSRLG